MKIARHHIIIEDAEHERLVRGIVHNLLLDCLYEIKFGDFIHLESWEIKTEEDGFVRHLCAMSTWQVCGIDENFKDRVFLMLRSAPKEVIPLVDGRWGCYRIDTRKPKE